MKTYWDLLATQFQHQGPPLRPSPEDTGIMERALSAWSRQHPNRPIQALMLGVTPEIAELAWPPCTHLTALEKSQPMIDLVWPGDLPGQRHVSRADWLEYPLLPASFDLIAGDGFMTGMSYPIQYTHIAKKFHLCLKPEGRAILRLFVRPEQAESMEDIRRRLKQGLYGTFDALKWRLGMALQKNAREGVAVADIHAAWTKLELDFPGLTELAGWQNSTVRTIHLYKGSNTRYHFPSLEELDKAFSPWLERESATFPSYDLGAGCPTLLYQPCKTPSQAAP